MIAEAELDALVDRGADDGPRRRSRSPRSSAASPVLVEKPLAATVDEALRIVAAAARARRARSRSATSSGSTRPCSSSAGCSPRAGCRASTRSPRRRAGPFPARIRDVGVTVDLATHDVDILSWIAGERPSRVYAETAQRIHADHEDLLFGLLHFPSGATGMLDVNWLTPAKRRQLVVVGEEGMFELDYLTQRLTFTRAHRHDEPAPDRRLRADVRGRGRRAAGRVRRAARRRARRVPRRRPRRRPADRRRRGRPLGRRRSPACPARRPRPSGAAIDLSDAVRRGSRSHDRSSSRPIRRLRRCSAARSSCPSTPAATSPRSRPRRGSASPGTSGRSRSSAPARWACRSPPSSRRTAGASPPSTSSRRSSTRSTRAQSHVGEEPGLAELVRTRPRRAAACARRRTAPAAAARVGRRRPHRPGHARRRAAARLPLHGRRRRVDRAGRPRGLAGHLRDDAAGRRHARPVRAAARGGSAACRADERLLRRVLAGAALSAAPRSATWRRIRSSSAGSGRRRRPGRRPSTTRSSTPRSWRCRPPRRPSSRSSPTRPTAT